MSDPHHSDRDIAVLDFEFNDKHLLDTIARK